MNLMHIFIGVSLIIVGFLIYVLVVISSTMIEGLEEMSLLEKVWYVMSELWPF